MIFNFDQKIISKNLKEPSVFHLPPSSDFTKHFVEGLLSRFEPGILSSKPELLGRLQILTSNKRLAKHIEEMLQLRGFNILPKIVQLDDLAEFFYESAIKITGQNKRQSHFQVISSLHRFLILESLIIEAQENGFKEVEKVNSFDLAKSLESLIDELNTNNVSVADLRKITEEELSQHLQLNLLLMRQVVLRYKKILMEIELIDKSSKYTLDVGHLISHWQLEPYDMPLLIVGSTGSQKATARLMHAISKLPQGLVILPGLDAYLTDRSWKNLTPDHPQYGFFALSKNWRLTDSQREQITKAPIWYQASPIDDIACRIAIRSHLFSLLMRPAPVTDEWRVEGKSILDDLKLAIDEISLIEAENSRLEAAAICVGIKEAVSEGSTVALISPSKQIARRVTAELKRWQIVPNNSLGINLAETDLGIFLRQGALVINSGFDFHGVIALLKNRNCGGEYAFHSINIIKLQKAPQQPDMSFLDLIDTNWLREQDDEFLNWYN